MQADWVEYWVKTVVFGASSSLPPLVNKRGKRVWSADEKVLLFLVHFDAKLCRDHFQQPHSCDPFPLLCSVTFRCIFVRSLLLYLDPNGRNDHEVMVLFFTNDRLADFVPVSNESSS